MTDIGFAIFLHLWSFGEKGHGLAHDDFTFTRMFVFFNLISQFSAEYINGNPDLKLAFKNIEELQKSVHTHEERISRLENQPVG